MTKNAATDLTSTNSLIAYPRNKQRIVRKINGFTLIEVMVVVVILSILAAIVVPKIMDRPEQARITKAKSDIRAIEASLNLYRLDNMIYPTTDQGLEALVSEPTDSPEPRNWKEGGYLDRLPVDPWGNPYLFLNPGTHGSIDIYSAGLDMQSIEDDFGNWNLE
ncbi:MAG: type II secretion system major pseudopilin GspG [Candidatus Thiodiazotropha sp. (ex Lucinoma aequizonata)]|nr:type II secretion system major pseudopilin GspG [Candidatus Thiodiazotropha sp. (ex Lucinoma aequizonata)]MCU7888427.1 type II secretion system major pseudopilin GspG [Candidatus Thiodiazotropha sp. (ex Lucinoma aequizonata)]MCU7896308.1 type II secretion system major pseudopilin GspG [Candidatus Thiodiazotropha sp. (ex Lucinoma aequizonata)]MCU7897276.1 type II secretion system major pseudopilin GspG [Candidatus Thiodiazotropha sp. (ex Lucinoma aequizonata)]MCU7903946.1 type II secretion sy